MANYVKFRRGLAKNFKREEADLDTLYFIYEEDESSADLYLGPKKISSGDLNASESIDSFHDVIIKTVQDKDILMYDNLEGAWVNKSLEDIFETITLDAEPFIKVVTNYFNNLHMDLINQEYDASNMNPKNGDIIAIRDLIVNNHYETTAYIFDGTEWHKMVENYNPNKIYFDSDLITTENIGAIKIDQSGSAFIPASGKNLLEVLNSILVSEKIPEVKQPYAVLEENNFISLYEVGEQCEPSYKISFNEGEYDYDTFTGVVPEYIVTCSETQEELNTSEGVFAGFTATDDMNCVITAQINYSDGILPHTNLGKECLEKQILGNSITLTSAPIRSFRRAFYGALNSKNESLISAENIKNNLNSTSTNLNIGEPIKIDLPADTMRVVIAYEASLPNLSKVLDENDSYSNIISAFGTPKIIQLNGASENTEINYKLYVLNFAREIGTQNSFTFII